MQRYQTRIGGNIRETARTELVRSPYDGRVVGEVGLLSQAQAEEATASVAAGFSAVKAMPTHARAALLERVATALADRAEELSSLITRESGKPIRYARLELTRAVTTFKLAAAESRCFGGETLPIDQQPGQEGRTCLYRRVPRGPVLAISPFNFPLNLAAHKVAPALAVGASVLLKPPAQTPLTAHVLADIVRDAGAPSGALELAHCDSEVASSLVTDPRLAVLSFTGSDSLGFRLQRLAERKRVLLELGGNAPCIVDEGVDIDAVMPRLLESAWASAGQVCIKAQRFYVHERLFDAFLTAFVAGSEALAVGDPLDEQTVVGPLIEPRHVERVLEWVREAEAQGARLLSGGQARGACVLPTVLTNTRPEMRVCSEEVFGPVSVVEPFSSFEQALDSANRGRYGLQASVFTPRIDHALKAYEVLEFGAVLINEVTSFRVDNYPYGGAKDSGIGREGVRFAMEEMTEPKVLILRAQ